MAAGDPEVIAMPVGQIVGALHEVRPVAEVFAELVEGFDAAATRLAGFRDGGADGDRG